MEHELFGTRSQLNFFECSPLSRDHCIQIVVVVLGLERCGCVVSDGWNSGSWWLRLIKDNGRQLHQSSDH